jgi:integrase
MKTVLTIDFVKKVSLKIRPVVTPAGRIVFEESASKKDYFVWDASDSAPPGFGLRVAAKKTYVLRRKIHGKGVMPKVGNVADFLDLATARERAARMALKIVDSGGANPNAEAAKIAAGEITLGMAIAQHRASVTTKAGGSVAASTLKIYDRATKRFEDIGWTKRRIRDLTSREIIALFEERQNTAPTANEANFRWVSASVQQALVQEQLDASVQRREPSLGANPFDALTLGNKYRTRAMLTKVREGKRNPLGPMTSMGAFLEAAWSKRNSNDNATGVDSFIISLLFGTRKSEHVGCQWGDLLSESERDKASHVWLENSGRYGPYIYFAASEVKNRRAHRLPLVGMALELLKRRQVAAAEEAAHRGFDRKSRKWVFPAKSRFSATGHYSDGSTLLKIIAGECGVEKISPHDLRRSFGAAMSAINVPGGIKSRFFNHTSAREDKDEANVTAIYSQPEWALLVEWIAKIQQHILTTAPNIYNSLKPVDWPPLPAPEPHVCQPAKPRTGRPKRDAGVNASASDD